MYRDVESKRQLEGRRWALVVSIRMSLNRQATRGVDLHLDGQHGHSIA